MAYKTGKLSGETVENNRKRIQNPILVYKWKIKENMEYVGSACAKYTKTARIYVQNIKKKCGD